MADLYFWRQVFILTTSVFSTISSGIMIAFTSVLSPAILATKNTDIEATPDQVSWITTSNGIAAILGFVVLSPILQIFGRKVVHVTDSVVLLIGWIVFVLAHSVTALIAARIIHGIDMGSIFIQAMIISEYADPKRRGYFMTFKKVGIPIGILMCHALSLVWSWRQIATFAIILPTLTIVLTLFWPESPFYLAMKGRYKESEKSFVWLHGGSNMQELHLLHSSQQQKVNNSSPEKWHKFLFKKDFLKPFIIVSLLTLILELSGKHYFAVYAIQMMIELVGEQSLAIYFSMGADLLTVVALLSSFFIIRFFKRRTVLFSFGVATVALMLVICLVIVMKSSTVAWLAPVLIVLHCFIVNLSIIPVSFTIIGEIFPLEYKSWGSVMNGVVFTSSYTLILKLTPVLIDSAGVGNVYSIYGITIAICLLVLYYIVPETKDRSLQEIENILKGVALVNDEIMLPEGNEKF